MTAAQTGREPIRFPMGAEARPRPSSKNPRREQPTQADGYLLDGEPVSLADLLSANDFDEAEIAEITALPPGSSLRLGGGAAPLFTLSRGAVADTAGKRSRT